MVGLNRPLVWGGTMSLLAAFLHIAVIIGGPDWYRFFGAGDELARLAEEGSAIPGTITAFIALTLLLWSLYAFAGADLVRRLPWLKTVLMLITAIYLARGIALVPLALFAPPCSRYFLIISSLICLGIGLLHLTGIRHMLAVHKEKAC